jgi:hypothetical protein
MLILKLKIIYISFMTRYYVNTLVE